MIDEIRKLGGAAGLKRAEGNGRGLRPAVAINRLLIMMTMKLPLSHKRRRTYSTGNHVKSGNLAPY